MYESGIPHNVVICIQEYSKRERFNVLMHNLQTRGADLFEHYKTVAKLQRSAEHA
jgi:hypothetical protein